MQKFDYDVDPKAIKALSALSPWKTTLALAFDWLVIAAAIATSIHISHPAAYIAAVLVIGGRMHALATLIHEFAHYRFIAGKNASDWIGDLLLAWPLGATIDSYRHNHAAHHRYTNTEQDPDWTIKLGRKHFTFPQKWSYALSNLMGYVLAVNSIRDIRTALTLLSKDQDKVPRAYKAARLSFYIAAIAPITLLGVWKGFALYWVVPFFTAFPLLMYIRSVSEHFGSMDYDHQLGGTRTVYPYLWERAFMAPHNVHYHLDHHLYPSVPFYNLPGLHALLLTNRQFREDAHITRGYSTGVVRECLFPGTVDKASQGMVTPAE